MANDKKIYANLVLDNGEFIRIECPAQFAGEFYESVENGMKRGDRWSPLQWDGCRAEYLGVSLDIINMRRVVGLC